MRLIIITSALILFAFVSKAQEIDADNSYVGFDAKYLKNQIIEGTFKGFNGIIDISTNNINDSKFDVSIDISTINTNYVRRDTMLLGKEYLDVKEFPAATFKSSSFEKTNKGFKVTGELTLKGISEEISIPFSVLSYERKTILKGTFSIYRLDYNIGENVSTITVSENVNVKIYCLLKKKK